MVHRISTTWLWLSCLIGCSTNNPQTLSNEVYAGFSEKVLELSNILRSGEIIPNFGQTSTEILASSFGLLFYSSLSFSSYTKLISCFL